MSDSSKYTLHSVDKALEVLELLSEKPGLSLKEIADSLELSKSSVFRLTSTLMEHGFVTKRNNETFAVGPHLFTIGIAAKDQMDSLRIVRPYMAQIMMAVDEDVHFVIWENKYKTVMLERVLTKRSTMSYTAIGRPRYAHQTATGLAMLACCDDSFVQEYIDNVDFEIHTDYSIHDGQQLLSKIDEIHRLGYAVNEQGFEYGTSSIAVAIANRERQIVGGLSVSGNAVDIESKRSLIIPQLLSVRNELRNLSL